MAKLTLKELIKNSKDEFRKYVSQNSDLRKGTLSPQQLEANLEQTADKEAEYLAEAITKYLTQEVFSRIAILTNDVAKLKRANKVEDDSQVNT